MLHGVDRGSVKFIGAAMGLGVFVTWAGDNGIILHQVTFVVAQCLLCLQVVS